MILETFLSDIKNDSSLLLSYKNDSLTKKAFTEQIAHLTKLFEENKILGLEDFIVINTDNPLHFFPLVFSCWLNNLNIFFPNKDFLARNTTFDNCEYILQYDGHNVFLEQNPHYSKIDHGTKGDTVLFSSGSTGKPKGILHHHSHFFANAQSVLKEIGLTQYTSFTLLKPYLVSALSHFLVHLLSDSHLIFGDIETIEELETYTQRYPNLSIVGSPVHLIMALKHIDKNVQPTYFFSSGDLIYPSVIEKILKKFPSSRFFHVYGLAELAGRFFINQYDRHTDKNEYIKVGKNIEGIDYQIIDNELYVDSQFLFFGYIKDNAFIPVNRPHRTGDVAIENNGVVLEGRSDDEIKIGGNKISLKNIERKLSTLFKDDVVIMVPYLQEPFGTLVALCIYGENAYTKKEVVQKIRPLLQLYELPHKYVKLDKIEYTQTFKIDRKTIASRLSTYEEIR